MPALNPYDAPEFQESDVKKQTLRLIRLRNALTIALIGLVGMIPFSMAISMMATFKQLSSVEVIEPGQLADGISDSLLIGVILIPFAVVAFIARSAVSLRLKRMQEAATPIGGKRWMPKDV